MLRLEVAKAEFYNEITEEFEYIEPTILEIEHSLISISKWEARWHKPFLSTEEKTVEQINHYLRCMTINRNISEEVYKALTPQHYKAIQDYMSDPMTATVIKDGSKSKGNAETLTSELIYYYMFAHNIPLECERWHINRLLTLIRVCNIKSAPPKKKPEREVLRDQAALNAARRKQLNTKG